MSSWAERILATLLVVFLLVGGLWLYTRLDEVFERPDPVAYERVEGVPAAQAEARRAAQALEGRQARLREAEAALDEALVDYEVAREEYRTALEEGRDDAGLRAAHDSALAAFEAQQVRLEGARSLVVESETVLAAAQAELDGRAGRAAAAFRGAERRYEAAAAGLRLAYLIGAFALSLWAWRRLQRRDSRWAIIGMAAVVAASLQMAVMAGDYAWHHLSQYAPAVISLAGVAGTVAAIVATQRFLMAPARVGRRRLRHGECPYCGHPLVQAAEHCAGCGRTVLLPCPHCGGVHPAFSGYCPQTGDELLEPPLEVGPPATRGRARRSSRPADESQQTPTGDSDAHD